MADIDWVEMTKHNFFYKRKSPSPQECGEFARSLTGASVIRTIDSPSFKSYTVICSGCPGEPMELVLTFREVGTEQDPRLYELAQKSHPDLAREYTYHGKVKNSDPPLDVYSMPIAEGMSLLSSLVCKVNLSLAQKATQFYIMRGLGIYFGNIYEKGKPRRADLLYPQEAYITRQLTEFKTKNILPASEVDQLMKYLPIMFGSDYPQVPTNCNLSMTNVRLSGRNCELVGIADWGCAKLLPFGMELDILWETTGFLDFGKWERYDCAEECLDEFWDMFWRRSGLGWVTPITVKRKRVREQALAAAKIHAILRFAFKRDQDGWPAGPFSITDHNIRLLRAWFNVD